MRAPTLVGTIDRRLLVTYRTDPETTARLLPAPLRPQLVRGSAVAGICLMRLAGLHPRLVPGRRGVSSVNAAHRIAVEWDTPKGVVTGVYIPRRDSGSLLNVAVGGRLFPAQLHRARFELVENAGELRFGFASVDGVTFARTHTRAAGALTTSRLFADLGQASDFFRRGDRGYSATDGGCLDGVQMRTTDWRVEPVEILDVSSSYFDDPDRFLPGTATVDSAVLMRDVPVTWVPLPPMAVRPRPAQSPG